MDKKEYSDVIKEVLTKLSEKQEKQQQTNDLRSNLFMVIIHVPHEDKKWRLSRNDLSLMFENYACIFHTRDKVSQEEVDNGIYPLDKLDHAKPYHYHIVVKISSRRLPHALLKSISNILQIPQDCIGVQKITDLVKMMRYLTHKDNSEKAQYNDDEVITNNRLWYTSNLFMDEIAFTRYLNHEIELSQGNIFRLSTRIGINTVRKYISYINLAFRQLGYKED